MSGEHPQVRRMRLVQALLRELRQGEGPSPLSRHFDSAELARLVGGSLLEIEFPRFENHLLACAECRERARGLHADFEAGVVPVLLGREAGASERAQNRTLGPRRALPWAIAALVFAVVVWLPLSIGDCIGRKDFVVEEPLFVLQRAGRPRALPTGESTATAVVSGAWLAVGDRLEIEPGGLVCALSRQGVVSHIGADARQTVDDPAELLARIYASAAAQRAEIALAAAAAVETPLEPRRRPRIVHPRRTILATRPILRWSDEEIDTPHQVSIADRENPTRKLFTARSTGRHLEWPYDARPLEPGHRYLVEVKIENDGLPAIVGEFEVVDRPRRDELEQELQSLERLLGSQRNVLRALWYLQSGLHGEAREELERIRAADSGNLEILRLLKSVYRDLGLRREEDHLLEAIRNRG